MKWPSKVQHHKDKIPSPCLRQKFFTLGNISYLWKKFNLWKPLSSLVKFFNCWTFGSKIYLITSISFLHHCRKHFNLHSGERFQKHFHIFIFQSCHHFMSSPFSSAIFSTKFEINTQASTIIILRKTLTRARESADNFPTLKRFFFRLFFFSPAHAHFPYKWWWMERWWKCRFLFPQTHADTFFSKVNSKLCITKICKIFCLLPFFPRISQAVFKRSHNYKRKLFHSSKKHLNILGEHV